MASSLGIKFPIVDTQDGGLIGTTKNDVDKVKSNLIAFLTLKRRERVMQSNMYSPLWDYILEQWDEIAEDRLRLDLEAKLKEFMPEIKVSNISFTLLEEYENTVAIKITYLIVDLKVVDNVTLNLEVQI